jgi:hypothetical protein
MSVVSPTGLISQAFNFGGLNGRLYIPGITHGGARLGYIGNLAQSGTNNEAATAAPATSQQRVQFLCEAKNKLLTMGADRIIGPVDGDTWHKYRLPLAGFSAPNFLEPSYHPFSQADFLAAGMPVIATYHSSAVEDLTLAMQKLAEGETLDQRAITAGGIKVRSIRLDAFDGEMALLHRFCLEAFKQNFLFNTIDLPAFQSLYRPVAGLLRSELVLIAEDRQGKILAVVLTVPEPGMRRTIVVKTLARHATAPRGLGRYLFFEVLARAHQLGYERAECSLMKDDNFSSFLPDQIGGKVVRRFALFGSGSDDNH